MFPLIPILLGLTLLSSGIHTAGNFYQANKQNELYNAQLSDMRSYLDEYKKKGYYVSNKYPNLGYQGRMRSLQTSIDLNNTMPYFGMASSLAGVGAGATGAVYSRTANMYKFKPGKGSSMMYY